MSGIYSGDRRKVLRRCTRGQYAYRVQRVINKLARVSNRITWFYLEERGGYVAGDRPSDHCPPIDFAPPRPAADDSSRPITRPYLCGLSRREGNEITVLRAPLPFPPGRIDTNRELFLEEFFTRRSRIGDNRGHVSMTKSSN